MTNETKTGAELSQNESRNSTLKSQLKEGATPAGSEPATPLTDAARQYWWCPHCKKEVPPTQVTYHELHESCGYEVESIHPNDDSCSDPSRLCDRIADLERQLAEAKDCVKSLHAILKERNCCTPEDYWDINQMVIKAMKEGE